MKMSDVVLRCSSMAIDVRKFLENEKFPQQSYNLSYKNLELNTEPISEADFMLNTRLGRKLNSKQHYQNINHAACVVISKTCYLNSHDLCGHPNKRSGNVKM